MNAIVSSSQKSSGSKATNEPDLETLVLRSPVHYIYGPETFVASSSIELIKRRDLNNTDVDYFQDFALVAQNGIAGRAKVTRVEIRIDGVLILQTQDFVNMNIVTRPVSRLTHDSVIEVKYRGRMGSFIRLLIHGTLRANVISDIDGNYYKTVMIGNQLWMAENLGTTRYNDGTAIPYGHGRDAGDYRWYNDDICHRKPFGALYSWQAVNTQKLCPAGWHVPSMDEWQTLTDFLTNNGYGFGGSGDDIAKALASVSGWKWDSNPGNAGNDQTTNNASGFNGLPAGLLLRPHDWFMLFGEYACWWTSSKPYRDPQFERMENISSKIFMLSDSEPCSFSVRGIKD